MKPSKKLLLFYALILTSLSCSFTNLIQFDQLPDRVSGSRDEDSSSPEILAEEFLEDTLVWNCRANDLREYLGESWENYPTDLQDLVMDVKSTGDTLDYDFSFSHRDPWIIKTDPDHWALPGATQVPDGEYDIVTTYHAYGSARLEFIFKGKVTVDYEVTTYLPDPTVNSGSLGYITIGYDSRAERTLEICFDVIADEIESITTPADLRENCRWPGYTFRCTPGQ